MRRPPGRRKREGEYEVMTWGGYIRQRNNPGEQHVRQGHHQFYIAGQSSEIPAMQMKKAERSVKRNVGIPLSCNCVG